MDEYIKSFLYDVLQSLNEIDSYFENGTMSFEELTSDIKTKRAVERNLEIIGEALNRALKIDKNLSIEHARQIVDTRNRIIHGYDSVSDEILWSIIIKYLPRLRSDVEKLLGE